MVQETLHFDPDTGEIHSLRSKEEAHDYRYFPEPDLVPMVARPGLGRGAARAASPSCRSPGGGAGSAELGLTYEDAEVLSETPELGDYFEAVAARPTRRRRPTGSAASCAPSCARRARSRGRAG